MRLNLDISTSSNALWPLKLVLQKTKNAQIHIFIVSIQKMKCKTTCRNKNVPPKKKELFLPQKKFVHTIALPNVTNPTTTNILRRRTT
jgi:hypothetical protein